MLLSEGAHVLDRRRGNGQRFGVGHLPQCFEMLRGDELAADEADTDLGHLCIQNSRMSSPGRGSRRDQKGDFVAKSHRVAHGSSSDR